MAEQVLIPGLAAVPTVVDVVALQAVTDHPAVTVLMTTTPAERMTADDRDRLHGLVGDAVSRLRAQLPADQARPFADALRCLALEAAQDATRQAVGLFVGRETNVLWRLSVPVHDRTVIGSTFATRDLVRSLHRTPRHVVLVLTEHNAKLYDGVGDLLTPAITPAFPVHRASAFDAFLRTVDRALGRHLRLHPAPLVIVAADRTASAFRSVSTNTGRLAGVVRGSHAQTPLHQLAPLIRPLLERYLRSREHEALALLEARTSARRSVDGMQSVWLAARAERPEMLAVEEGFFYPARLSADGNYVVPAADVDDPDVLDDAVDEVIETVLQRGGWVALVSDGTLAERGRIALTLRR